jgi:hypothetical protein
MKTILALFFSSVSILSVANAAPAKKIGCYLDDLESKQGSDDLFIEDFASANPKIYFYSQDLGPDAKRSDLSSVKIDLHEYRTGGSYSSNHIDYTGITNMDQNQLFKAGSKIKVRYVPGAEIVVIMGNDEDGLPETVIGECNIGVGEGE